MQKTLIFTALAALALAGCSKEAATTATPVAAATLPQDVRDLAKPAAPKVEQTSRPAQPLETAAAPAPISATGELISPMRSQVAPKQPGRVAAVYVREGARVRRGEPLAEFETEYLRLDLRRAEAELDRAKAAESDASRDLSRKRDLITTLSVSRASLDRAQTAYESAVAAREAAEAIVASIRQHIADSTLRAPFDGVVESRTINVGEHVGDGAAFVIAQTSSLKLRFRLPEQFLGRVHEGQEVKATAEAYGASSFTARITMIGGVIEPATRTLMAEADVDNSAGHLRPGMFARVTVAQ